MAGRNLAEGRAAAFGQRRYQLVGGRRAERSDPPSSGLASTQPVLPGSVLLLCAPLCPPAPSTPPSNPSHTAPNPTPHPPQTRRCAPPVRPLAPLPPRLAPIYGVARRWRVRQRMCTQHRHTDGLLGNLALDEIAGLVERDAARGPRALARRLASAARARRLRPDDVTVVAVLLDERGSTVDASSVAAWGAMGLLGLAAASALQLGAW